MAWKLSFPLCLALVSVHDLDLAIAVLLPELHIKICFSPSALLLACGFVFRLFRGVLQ